MITITSNDYGYIILRYLNLGYKEVGTIEESSLFLSELKSLKSLKDFKRVNISDEDYLKITDRIKFLSIVPGTTEPNLPPMWGSIEGNLNTQLDLFGKLTEIENNTVTNLATVATSGNYDDLTNKPTIPMLPTLATVATSGSYTDLTNKPDLTLKQNSLPTTGTAGQFLAHDMTFKTLASGSTVNEYSSTALASAWTGTNPSVLALTVTGLLATHKTVLDVDLSSETFANIDGVQADYALIYRAVPTANTLTLYASKKPTKDLSLKLVVLNG